MQTSTNTKYFVAAFAAIAVSFAGYTYFGTDTDAIDNTAATATITAPSSNYIENAQPAVQTRPTNVAPASGEVEADASTTK